MLFSLAILILAALTLSEIMKKIRLPGLTGMLIVGIVLSPFLLDLIAPQILEISSEIRRIALIIILIRAGLALNISDLRQIGRPAVLMCFVPASFEILATIVFAPLLLGVTLLDAAILGTVLAAVSPAVIVPKMLVLIGKTRKNVPQLIMAGASVDDIFVIVLFSAFLGMAMGGNSSFAEFLQIPLNIILGAIIGFFCGWILSNFFKKFSPRDTIKLIIMLSLAFLLVAVEEILHMSGLLAVMAMGATILAKNSEIAKRLSDKTSKIWIIAEIFLFVLVGATINLETAVQEGFSAILLIFSVLIFRFLGVLLCLIKTEFNAKERLFCGIAYLPKATVQAAIGGLPLAAGIAAGNKILTVAVLAILITAPLGALGIDVFQKYLLEN
ncbi:MAG: cation:proton antiporter [Firmicutes bacterium]|nr:cation:proton antiporter [Bacillota bacterium]